MNALNNAVLLILQSALWNQPQSGLPEVDKHLVFMEMKRQTVASLAENVFTHFNLSDVLKREWLLEIMHQLRHNEQCLYNQKQLLMLLNEHGIPAVILKGASAAQYYPKPEYRTMGDVDFLVPVERFEETLSLLLAKGYHQCSEMIDGYCEVVLQKNGTIFELHRGLNAVGDISVSAVDDYVVNGLNHLVLRDIGEYTFPALPELPNGLVLLSHIRQHLYGGLGLRQIIDWMMYVAHSLDDSMWQSTFREAAKNCGLEKLAVTVTRMCQIYLGLSERITWCASADEVVCAELMTYIFMSGNFGRKFDVHDRAVQHTMMQENYPWKLLLTLQSKGKNRSVVKKHPFLCPIAWLIQLFHYVKRILIRGAVIKTLRSDSRQAHRMQNLFKKLEINKRDS